MDSIATVGAALDLARRRADEVQSFAVYASCVAQLEYLLSTLKREIPVDRPRLRTIMVGHYGAREFDETDPELARALMDAQFIASKMADGLKVG